MAKNKGYKYEVGTVGEFDSCIVQVVGYKQMKKEIPGADLFNKNRDYNINDFYILNIITNNKVNIISVTNLRKEYFESNFKDLGPNAKILFGQKGK